MKSHVKKITARNTVFALSVLVMALLLSAGITAQTAQQSSIEVSDQELQQFSTAITAVQDIQTQMQRDIDRMIQQSILSRERFLEILNASQSLGSGDSANVSESEQKAYDSLVSDITELQSNSQDLMTQAVKGAGLELERFNEILTALQNDSSLMDRLMPYLQDQSNQPVPAPQQQ